MVVEPEDRALRKDVELLHLFALHVLLTGAAQDLGQAGARGFAGNDLGRQRHIVEQVGEAARGVGMLGLLVEDEALDRHQLAGIALHVSHRRLSPYRL